MALLCDVAVVGAGPAGSTLAHRLAAGGARVVLFDHSHPREKVCGGGVSARARTMFPELEPLVPLGREGTMLRLVSPLGLTVEVAGRGRTFAIDRTILDRALLDRAVAAGADWREERVVDLDREPGGWRLHTKHGSWLARVVAGADGALSLVRRQVVGVIPNQHMALGAHVLVEKLNPPSALLKFFGDRRGYAWVFNRKDRSSIGVGMPREKCHAWRQMLARFHRKHAPMRQMPEAQGWVLPQATRAEFFRTATAGEDWVLVGDAAGHVDPLTGEGIWYAMWGAQLAADAILAGAPADYDRLWREAFLARFETRVKLALLLEGRVLLDAVLATGRLPVVGSRLFSAIVAE